MTDDVQDRTTEGTGDQAAESPAPARKSAPAGTTPVVRRPSPANVRRQAKKEMSRRAAQARRRARRRRQLLSYSGVAGVVVVLLVAGWLLFGHGGGKKSSTTEPQNCPSSSVQLDPALCTKPTVAAGEGAAPTELKVTPLITGTGPQVQAGQTITVNYVGVTWADGAEFDSSWKNNQTASFSIGTGNVIQGWDQGLVGQTVGSRVQLDIPSALAYGDSPTNGSPAGALRFVVDIIDATGSPAPVSPSASDSGSAPAASASANPSS